MISLWPEATPCWPANILFEPAKCPSKHIRFRNDRVRLNHSEHNTQGGESPRSERDGGKDGRKDETTGRAERAVGKAAEDQAGLPVRDDVRGFPGGFWWARDVFF